MLIKSNSKLKNYTSECRLWEGVPSIERTENGRIYITFYSGMTGEEQGNYSVLIKSDDDGKTFSEPIAVADNGKQSRCFDPCLWIDPLKRLWFIWTTSPENNVYASVCNNPDAETPVINKPFIIGRGVMINKPIVLSTGEWLFPISAWKGKYSRYISAGESIVPENEQKAYAYKTVDNGKTFIRLGGVDMEKRCFDEHIFLERKNGNIVMYLRTLLGIGAAYSFDKGVSWKTIGTEVIKNPSSRFHIRRLKSGRVLLVNHYLFSGRNNIYALLSEDEGVTFKYKLLLDERKGISYPDVTEGNNGYIYITYDHGRGAFRKSLKSVESCVREILMAKITENDIINGKIVDKNSKLKCVVNALGKYNGKDKNPYREKNLYNADEYVNYLLNDFSAEDAINKFFVDFGYLCSDISRDDRNSIDSDIAEFLNSKTNEVEAAYFLNNIVKRAYQLYYSQGNSDNYYVKRMLEYINANYKNGFSLSEMSKSLNMSKYYMCHIFKRETMLSPKQYRIYQQIFMAKNQLLTTNDSVKSVAISQGFCNDAYFVKVFKQACGVTPSEFRKKHNK